MKSRRMYGNRLRSCIWLGDDGVLAAANGDSEAREDFYFFKPYWAWSRICLGRQAKNNDSEFKVKTMP